MVSISRNLLYCISYPKDVGYSIVIHVYTHFFIYLKKKDKTKGFNPVRKTSNIVCLDFLLLKNVDYSF